MAYYDCQDHVGMAHKFMQRTPEISSMSHEISSVFCEVSVERYCLEELH